MGKPKSSASSQRSAQTKFLRAIGLRIHRELYERQIALDVFAAETGLARSTLCEIIAGRSNPRVLSLLAIVRALGYRSIPEFLEESEN